MQELMRADHGAPVPQIEDDEIDLVQLFGTIWRGKWIIAFCASVAVALGGYYAFKVAIPKYTASTTLALQVSGSQVVDIESVMSGVSSDFYSLNTEIEVIKSRKLGEQLVRSLNLTTDPDFNPYLREFSPPFYEHYLQEWFGIEPAEISAPTEYQVFNVAVLNAMGSISASLQRNTYIFSISAKTVDPVKSVLLANTLAELYIADQIAVKFEATENAVTWLSERVSELEIELKEREDSIKDLIAGAGSSLVTPELIASLNQQANDLQNRLDGMQSEAEGAETRLAELEVIKERSLPEEMRAVFSDPVLQRLFNELAAGSDSTGALFGSRFELLVDRERSDTLRAVAQAQSLQLSYAALQDQISEQTQDLIELQQLEREVEATRVLYDTFLSRLKETTVQRGLQESDARILSPAINGVYVEPRKSRILALSFLLGSILGVGLVLLQQFLHNGFRTAEDLERYTGVAVMGQLPKMPISRRNRLVPYLINKPTSAAAEAVRNLRTSVLLSNIDSPPRVIMSTSSVPGEGKTTQAIALAHNFVGLGKSVLLLEGDIRRRTFGQYFKDTPEGGLIEALAGERPLNEVVFRDQDLGADVLMGEKSSINAADLFSSDRFHDFIKMAREAYDIVIIDTPPVLVVPDARVIGQSVDAIVYSVRWDSTAKGQVQEGLRQFATANLKVTGFVLSQIDVKGMAKYGYGGKHGAYGAYAKYGKHYYDT